jgi:hypothetical protein
MEPKPATVSLASFANIEIMPVVIDPPFDTSSANKKAAKKINTYLREHMAEALPTVNALDKSEGSTLLIKPRIKEIKYIGWVARFWAGTLAGSSAVLMDATYLNKDTGQVISQPEFYNHSFRAAGAWTMGATDRLMLDNVARQIIKYSAENR